MSQEEEIRRPEPRRWPEPITIEQYRAFMPDKLELVDGYLIDGPDRPERRLALLALLLTNCGLEDAMFLTHKDDVRDAVDRVFGGLYE